MKLNLSKAGKIWFIIALLLIPFDYITSMISQNYATFDYQMNIIVFIMLISMFTYYTFKSLDNYFNNEKIEEVDDDDSYMESGYEEHLQKVLESHQFKSILINGPFGSGKTTMLEHVLKLMNVKKNEYIKFDLYGEEIDNNLEYTYEKFRQMEPWFIYILKQVLNYTFVSIFTFFSIALAAIITKDVNLKITVVILLIYTGISVYIKYSNTDGFKKQYIAKQLANIKFVIIDDLDRAYNDNTKIISFIHALTKFINDAENTKLILVGNRLSFNVQGTTHDETVHILEKYYDYEFEIPIDIIKYDQIKIFEENLPEIHYNNEELTDAISLLKTCSTREIIKLNKQINFINEVDPVIIKKLYLSDYIFVLILYIRNKVDVQNLLNSLHNEITLQLLTFKSKNLHEILNEICINFKVSEEEKKFIDNSLKYTTSENRAYIIGAARYDNRLFDIPTYYKKNYFITNRLSPEERIVNFEKTLLENPQEIKSTDFYFFYSSNIESNTIERVTSLMIEMSKKENAYSANLSDSIRYTISENDPRIDLNIKYNWSYGISLNDHKYFLTLSNLINDQNFTELNIENRANLIEREEICGSEKKYFNLINKDDYVHYIDAYIMNKRPYYIFNIFGEDIPGLNTKQIENLLKLYKEYLMLIKTKYNYYTNNPASGNRTDDGDEDLIAYNKFKSIIADNYDVDVSEYYFSFDDEITEGEE